MRGHTRGAEDVRIQLHAGPELEVAGSNIGVVTSIAAPATIHVEFHGDGGHAGSQLMPLRCAVTSAANEACQEHRLSSTAQSEHDATFSACGVRRSECIHVNVKENSVLARSE